MDLAFLEVRLLEAHVEADNFGVIFMVEARNAVECVLASGIVGRVDDGGESGAFALQNPIDPLH